VADEQGDDVQWGTERDPANFDARAKEHGHFVAMRLHVRPPEGDEEEDMYSLEALPAKLIGEKGAPTIGLRIEDETYIVRVHDLEDALTDPATYDEGEDGPMPIDVLRAPPGDD
jgi:hypothetical protein